MLEAVISSVSLLRPTPQTTTTVRVDNAPGLYALRNNPVLQQHSIILDFGRIKNPNKNPVADKAIAELHREIVRQLPDGGPLSNITLANVVSQLNSRLRMSGLSAWEVYHKRDQFSGNTIHMPDEVITEIKSHSRESNHNPSAKFKARGGPAASNASIEIGSLVYIKSEHDKTKPRDRYIVISIENDSCVLQKLVKSQLRSKRYDLKLTEITPVVNELPDTDPLPDQPSNDSDSDVEFDYQPDEKVITADLPTPPRRSIRNRTQPPWMRSGEYELENEENEE